MDRFFPYPGMPGTPPRNPSPGGGSGAGFGVLEPSPDRPRGHPRGHPNLPPDSPQPAPQGCHSGPSLPGLGPQIEPILGTESVPMIGSCRTWCRNTKFCQSQDDMLTQSERLCQHVIPRLQKFVRSAQISAIWTPRITNFFPKNWNSLASRSQKLQNSVISVIRTPRITNFFPKSWDPLASRSQNYRILQFLRSGHPRITKFFPKIWDSLASRSQKLQNSVIPRSCVPGGSQNLC